MKCEEFKDRLLTEYENITEAMNDPQLADHINNCSSCLDFREHVLDIQSRLSPRPIPGLTEANFKNQKIKAMKTDSKKSKRRQILRYVSYAAVVAVVCTVMATGMIHPNQTRAAGNLLNSSMNVLGKIETMVMDMDIRTRPDDNFEIIDLDEELIENKLVVDYRGGKPQWMIKKQGRIVVETGEEIYLWLPALKEGYILTSGYNVLGWLEPFLSPRTLLAQEKAALDGKRSKYRIDTKKDEIILTVEDKAVGKFVGGVGFNSTLIESNNKRVYVFDKHTELLKDVKIYVKDGKKEVLVLTTRSIRFNEPVDVVLSSALPSDGVIWQDKRIDFYDRNFMGITAKEAAEKIFSGFSSGNTAKIDAMLEYTGYDRQLKRELAGIKNVKVGEPFKSGTYSGYYVPVKYDSPQGKKIETRIALRNDNEHGVWLLDGGVF